MTDSNRNTDPLFATRALAVAARLAGANVPQLVSEWRSPQVLVRARWAVMAAMAERGTPYKQIARRLNRDHSTVMYGCRRAKVFAEHCPDFRAMLDQVRAA